MMGNQDLSKNFEAVKDRIFQAAAKCGRDPDSIRLVAVSKTMPVEIVRAAVAAGIPILGENYIQEARSKIELLSTNAVSWHFIGHLQTNKARYAVRLFDLIHSVDSLRLARELNKEAGKIKKTQAILIQVNIGKEASKSGVSAEDIKKLVEEVVQLENLSIRGLMTMPPFFNDPEKARPYFSLLRDLRDHICKEIEPVLNRKNSLDELSMGMTGDFETAIECGATLVRVGTAIFGERKRN